MAANIFSLIPPTGNTFPLSVISPVIANLLLTLFCVSKETKDVNMVIPALGPSFGVAPSGTWMWILYFSNGNFSNPISSFFDLINSKDIVADSFITFPRLPVIVNCPLPSEIADSINRISPPADVQAKPVTTPAV